MVAETFLVAHARWHTYQPARGEALPWLYGIATNLTRRHRRAEQRAYRAYARSAGPRLVDDDTERAAARVDAGPPVAISSRR